MNDWGIEDDANSMGNDSASTGPKALRDAYEALKKQNSELQSGLASIQSELKAQKVQSTLGELGVPPTVASFYQGDADPEKVKEWATAMQTAFGGNVGTPSAPAAPPVTLDEDATSQFQRMNDAGSQGAPLGNVEAAFGRVGDATDIKSLLEAFKTLNT